MAQSDHACSCGANPPAPPRDRVVAPYASEPTDLQPFAKFTEPYDRNYIHPNIYSGAGRDLPEPKDLTEIRIGFFGPIQNHPQQLFGQRMLHGAQMAVDEWNAAGGYGGKPFKLMLHNDYDNWQAKTVYGNDRPTDPAIWGAASDEVVKMVYDDQDWAIFGSISSESTHIALRVALRAEIPIVNSASTDPTIPETYIPWYFTNLQDDRVQAFTLARHIYSELGLKRIALLRVNERYGRFGVPKFRDASRRLGHPVAIEQKFFPGDTDFSHQLKVIQSSHVDGIVLWTDEKEAAGILKQMRAMGMKQRVFGSHRTLGATLLSEAGPAAEGFEAAFPYDPTRNDPRWTNFAAQYRAKYNEDPGQFSALAYDAMNQLLQSICRAGLNRARIHDALAEIDSYDGVTGHMVYDPNQKNVSPMYIGTVKDGQIHYRLAPFNAAVNTPKPPATPEPTATPNPPAQPYARVGEDGVTYSGPHSTATAALRAVIFGPNAAAVAARESMRFPGWQLLPVESKQSWGTATAQLVDALMDQRPIAVLALDRDSAHLAEQLALKSFLPVVALAEDHALTATNIPWIFRLPASTTPESAMNLIATAELLSGPNAESLRDLLASGTPIGTVAFASTGEPLPR